MVQIMYGPAETHAIDGVSVQLGRLCSKTCTLSKPVTFSFTFNEKLVTLGVSETSISVTDAH